MGRDVSHTSPRCLERVEDGVFGLRQMDSPKWKCFKALCAHARVLPSSNEENGDNDTCRATIRCWEQRPETLGMEGPLLFSRLTSSGEEPSLGHLISFSQVSSLAFYNLNLGKREKMTEMYNLYFFSMNQRKEVGTQKLKYNCEWQGNYILSVNRFSAVGLFPKRFSE